jgi:cytidylate kinase
MNAPRFIVMSGIPASGKSTLAKALNQKLDLEVSEKDAILESLFDDQPEVRLADRHALSREADEIFRKQVENSVGAIVVSFWMRIEYSTTSGTPTGWLSNLATTAAIVELHCLCNPATAAKRFVERVRHIDHGDNLKDCETIRNQFEQLSRLGGLGVGQTISVQTDKEVDLERLVDQIRQAFEAMAASNENSVSSHANLQTRVDER